MSFRQEAMWIVSDLAYLNISGYKNPPAKDEETYYSIITGIFRCNYMKWSDFYSFLFFFQTNNCTNNI